MSSMYPSFGGSARPCMRCGTPLALNESQCSRCGTYNPLPQGQQSGLFQQGAQGAGPGTSGPVWGAQSFQTPQFPQTGNETWPGAAGSSSAWGSTGQAGAWPQNNLFPAQNQPAFPLQQNQQNPFASNNGAGFSGQNQSAFNNSYPGFQQNPNQSALNNNFFNASQKNGYGSSPLGTLNGQARRGWAQAQGYQPDEKEKKKRPNMAAVTVIIVLIVALVGGGGFGAYYFLRHHSSPSSSTTTSAIVTPTGTPLFSDSFQDNKTGWDLTQTTGAQISLSGGKLVMESDNNKLFPELLPGKTFSDFRLDVDAGLTKGDQRNGYGVYIRGASTPDSPLGLYYRLEIYGNGYFFIYKGFQDTNGKSQYTALKQSLSASSAVNLQGQMNHLTIIAQGSQLTFIINNTTVSTFTDDSYKNGSIALFVSNVPSVAAGAQATFQHLAIFPAQ